MGIDYSVPNELWTYNNPIDIMYGVDQFQQVNDLCRSHPITLGTHSRVYPLAQSLIVEAGPQFQLQIDPLQLKVSVVPSY